MTLLTGYSSYNRLYLDSSCRRYDLKLKVRFWVRDLTGARRSGPRAPYDQPCPATAPARLSPVPERGRRGTGESGRVGDDPRVSTRSVDEIMSTGATSPTTNLGREELAEVLGVAPHTISGAAHAGYLCRGHPVHEWAVWHPRGNEVLHYKVPSSVIRDEVPPEEYARYNVKRY